MHTSPQKKDVTINVTLGYFLENTLKLFSPLYAILSTTLLFNPEGEKSARPTSPEGSRVSARTSSKQSRPTSVKPDIMARRRAQRETLKEAAEELLAHFTHRNLDAIVKVTRNTLEALRKRISSSTMVHYLGARGGLVRAQVLC